MQSSGRIADLLERLRSSYWFLPGLMAAVAAVSEEFDETMDALCPERIGTGSPAPGIEPPEVLPPGGSS